MYRINETIGPERGLFYWSGISVAILSLFIFALITVSGCSGGNPPVAGASVETSPTYAQGVYEFEVGNSVYPLSRGAFKGFQRYFNSGEQVRGSLEWKESYAIRYKWSLTVYAPDESLVLNWDGTDLEHNFSFSAATVGIYKIEILKRDPQARDARLVINPPNWDRWGIK